MEKVVIKSTFNRVIILNTEMSSSELTAVNSDVATRWQQTAIGQTLPHTGSKQPLCSLYFVPHFMG
jgi:hypothetical protein